MADNCAPCSFTESSHFVIILSIKLQWGMVFFVCKDQPPFPTSLSATLLISLEGQSPFQGGRPIFCRPPWAGWLFYILGHTKDEVIEMSFVSPKIKSKFESMPIDLKNAILARDVRLENMDDLMTVLEQIIAEDEGRG